MKVDAIERRLATFDPKIRCYLFYGPDEATSRLLAAQVQSSIGPDVERVNIPLATIRSEPGSIADEAAARSLFGSPRCIRVDGAGDECVQAIELLLHAAVAGDPVILVGGALRKDARLVKLLADERSTVVHASYPPDATDLARVAVRIGERYGLRIGNEQADRLVAASGADRAILEMEVAKLAAYADATPDDRKTVSDAMIDAVGASRDEADGRGLLDALFAGDARALDSMVSGYVDGTGVVVVRTVQRRLLAMAAARADMDRGASARTAVERLGRSLFWQEKENVLRDLSRWPSTRLAAAMERCDQLERTLKRSTGPGEVAAQNLYHQMARSVRRS